MRKRDRLDKKRNLRERQKMWRVATNGMICWQQPRHRLAYRLTAKQSRSEQRKRVNAANDVSLTRQDAVSLLRILIGGAR